MADEEGVSQETWTYLGRRVDPGNKLSYAWRTPQGDASYSKFHPSGARPGSMWTVYVDEKRSVFTGGDKAPAYSGLVDDDEKARLEVASNAAITEDRAAKQTKSDMEQITLETVCTPLREAYIRQNTPLGRSALITRVIQEITKGR